MAHIVGNLVASKGGGKVGIRDANGWRMSCGNGVTTHGGTGSGSGEGVSTGPYPSC